MKRKAELPLVEPLFSTYHNQGIAGAIIAENPSIRNWFLSNGVILSCDREFTAEECTTPRIDIKETAWDVCPYFTRVYHDLRFLGGYVDYLIINLIDNGYYVCFGGADDYYIKGKSFYRERHFDHDGMICGYDRNDKTFTVYAYDENWLLKKFKTPRESFRKSVKSMQSRWNYGYIEGVKPTKEQVEFSPTVALGKIREYLDSSLEKYPENINAPAYGIVVMDYAAKYTETLISEVVPYERTDRRFMRVIWEHKKAMYERISLIEKAYGLDSFLSDKYSELVENANRLRLLFAAHCLKRRNSLLPIIKTGLCEMKAVEKLILEALLHRTDGKI